MVQLNFKAVGNPLPQLSCQINTTSEEDYLIPLDVCFVLIVFLNNQVVVLKQDESCKLDAAEFETWACYKINTTRDGNVLCRATNYLGIEDLNILYYVSGKRQLNFSLSQYQVDFFEDVNNGFDLYDFNDGVIVDGSNVTVAENETLSFTCGVALKKSTDVRILINDDLPDEST